MSDPQNNFLIFNEANNQDTTMQDADYAIDSYRINGLIPMIADPKAHNKMFRQWSIMAKAVANMICDKGYNALDTDVTDLKNNLKTSVKDLARDELQSDINGKSNTGHTHTTADITDFASAASGISSEILNQIDDLQETVDNITSVINSPFPVWTAEKVYAVGDICIASNFKSYQYLECIVAGTADTTMPSYVNVGQMITDNNVKWLVCDFRDSIPVGSIKQDLVVRAGYLLLNGQTINVSDYPRLVSFLSTNSLIQPYTTSPVTTFTYGDSDNETLILPDFTNTTTLLPIIKY